jgi:3'(2'), 5'-bisphosphate nucleotidase
MNSTNFQILINGIKEIGDQISDWRNDDELRSILDPISFKTKADYKASNLLKNLIQTVDKGAVIVSEEDSSFDTNRKKSYWIIDPIDGTASWFDGFSGFVTQVAYIVNEEPIIGIVYAPALGKMWHGVKGKGAFLNHKRIKCNFDKTNDKLSLVDNYPNPRGIAKKVFESMALNCYLESGSLGLKSVLVADGTTDIFIKDVKIRDWDIAPAYVIIREVSGRMCDLNGSDIHFTGVYEKNNGLLVTRNLQVAQAVLDSLNMGEVND